MGAVTLRHATGETTIVSAARGFGVHVRVSCSKSDDADEEEAP